MSFSIIEETIAACGDEPGRRYLVAVDADDVEICGAYQIVGKDYWTLHVSQLVARLTGLVTPPHREHFPGCRGRQDATAWVELIACLYDRAARPVARPAPAPVVLQAVFTPSDAAELAARAAQFEGVDCSGMCAVVDEEGLT